MVLLLWCCVVVVLIHLRFFRKVKWAKALHAFQTAMDPCRRVFGTYRDYMISWGLPFGYAAEKAGNILNAAN